MIDIEGTTYEGIITLAPFTSLVLLGSGSVTKDSEILVSVKSILVKYGII
jgi:hypothetical protein